MLVSPVIAADGTGPFTCYAMGPIGWVRNDHHCGRYWSLSIKKVIDWTLIAKVVPRARHTLVTQRGTIAVKTRYPFVTAADKGPVSWPVTHQSSVNRESDARSEVR